MPTRFPFSAEGRRTWRTILTLLILFIFGGEVTRGFSFAMLIGVITGTYSTIYVSAPVLVDLARNKPLSGMQQDDAPAKRK